MALEDLPNGFFIPQRNDVRDRFQRNVVLRQEGAPTGEGSQAFVDGSVIADTLMPLYANAASIGRGANLADMTREQLKAEAAALGIPAELSASAGAGFVVIAASGGGVFIDEGKQLKDESTQLTFRCSRAGTYFDGRAVPVIGVDVGPTTNLAAGSRLRWTNPPAGLGVVATVQADALGKGLTGGRNAEADDDIRARISAERADPGAGGNVAMVRRLVEDAGRDLGIAVQAVFVYPAITGSGHYAYVFTLRPGSPGDSRAPEAVQIAAVRAYVQRALPEDDGIFAAEILEEPVTAKLGVRWAPTAQGWLDASPWPPESELWFVSAVTDANDFNVKSLTPTTAPQPGQTFGFYDASAGTFARKKILTAASLGGGEYAVVVDQTNNSSDVNYVPAVNDEMCPWSDSLNLLVGPLLSRADLLGPGEQVADFFDEGYRQKRVPLNPLEWPSELRHKDIDAVDGLDQVYDAEWLSPALPHAPSTGVAGASSNLVTVGVILAFPI